MLVTDYFPDSEIILELKTEELAVRRLSYVKMRPRTGPQWLSPAHRGNICTEIAHSYRPERKTPHQHENEIKRRIAEAFDYLNSNNLIAPEPDQDNTFYVTPRGTEIETYGDLEDSMLLRVFTDNQLHPEVANTAYDAFLRGDYEYAVFSVLKKLEEKVRIAAKLPNTKLGPNLMRQVFGKGGFLFDPSEVAAEAESIEHVYAGVIGYLKNPTSHRTVEHDPKEATEILFMASCLYGQVDRRIRYQEHHSTVPEEE